MCLKYSKWEHTTCNRNTCTVPCYSTVARLDVDACVYDVTSHYVVGEVRFQDVEIGIDCNLEKVKTNEHSAWAALRVNHISMSREKLRKKNNNVTPSRYSFLEERQWCRSTGSRCWQRRCHDILDSVPENTSRNPPQVWFNALTL